MQLALGNGEWQVRNWRLSDEAALVKYANNRRISINLRDTFPYPYTADDARYWINFSRAQDPQLNFAIASETEAIGGIGLWLFDDVFRRSAEIGYWVAEPFWGRGIATLAVGAVTDYAFASFDLVRVFAEVFEWNPASARVLEKAGYTYEGRFRRSVTKDGKTMDRLVYAIIKDDG